MEKHFATELNKVELQAEDFMLPEPRDENVLVRMAENSKPMDTILS